MSALVTNTYQVGQDADPTKNFVIKAPNDGTLVVSRGNIGAEIKTLLKINADNGVNTLGPCFSATTSAAQSVSASTWTKVNVNTEDFDTASAFDSVTNYRFQPTIAGYYQINGSLYVTATSLATAGAAIYKNAVTKARSLDTMSSNANASQMLSVSTLVYLNGTTDYVELFGFCNAASGMTVGGNGYDFCHFSGHLVRAA